MCPKASQRPVWSLSSYQSDFLPLESQSHPHPQQTPGNQPQTKEAHLLVSEPQFTWMPFALLCVSLVRPVHDSRANSHGNLPSKDSTLHCFRREWGNGNFPSFLLGRIGFCRESRSFKKKHTHQVPLHWAGKPSSLPGSSRHSGPGVGHAAVRLRFQ